MLADLELWAQLGQTDKILPMGIRFYLMYMMQKMGSFSSSSQIAGSSFSSCNAHLNGTVMPRPVFSEQPSTTLWTAHLGDTWEAIYTAKSWRTWPTCWASAQTLILVLAGYCTCAFRFGLFYSRLNIPIAASVNRCFCSDTCWFSPWSSDPALVGITSPQREMFHLWFCLDGPSSLQSNIQPNLFISTDLNTYDSKDC